MLAEIKMSAIQLFNLLAALHKPDKSSQIEWPRVRFMASTVLGGVASILIAAGCASAGPYDPEGIGAGQAERIGQICRQTMGLQPGEGQFDFCVGSLSRELRGQLQASALVASRQACLARGLPSGSPGLAECELQTSGSMPTPQAFQPSSMAAPAAASSFFHTTPDEAFHRAQASCAALGLEPVSDAFASCVANLNASMQPETPEG